MHLGLLSGQQLEARRDMSWAVPSGVIASAEELERLSQEGAASLAAARDELAQVRARLGDADSQGDSARQEPGLAIERQGAGGRRAVPRRCGVGVGGNSEDE